MTDYADLEKRLRADRTGWYYEPHMPEHDGNEHLLDEAADALASLRRELEEATEALQPFARVGETFVKTSDDPLVPWGTSDATRVDLFRASAVTRDYITAGDMRRAAHFLSRAAPSTETERSE